MSARAGALHTELGPVGELLLDVLPDLLRLQPQRITDEIETRLSIWRLGNQKLITKRSAADLYRQALSRMPPCSRTARKYSYPVIRFVLAEPLQRIGGNKALRSAAVSPGRLSMSLPGSSSPKGNG